MTKLILSLTAAMLFFSGTVLGNGINFVSNKNWKSLLAQAKKEKKLIFLDAYATWCGPCKYLQQEVFNQPEVGTYYNATFINAKIDMEKGEGPALSDALEITAYPTLLFINGDGKVMHKYIGALEPNEFLQLGKDASDPKKQYYPLKSKAAIGILAPTEFHNWIHAAEKLRDKDKEEIITKYLASAAYPLLQKDMLNIVFDHAPILPEKHLKELWTKKKEVMKIKEWTEEEYTKAFTAQVVSFAIHHSLDKENDEMDFTLLEKTVARFIPEKARLETVKTKVRYYFAIDEKAKALDTLSAILSNHMLRIPAKEMASLITDNAKEIIAAKRANEFISKIGKFTLLPSEKSIGYFKDLAMLSIYYHLEDQAKVAALVAKISKDKEAPSELKQSISRL